MAAAALSPEAQREKDKGNAHFSAKEYPQALDSYKRALELCPDNAVLLSNMSATHLGMQQWREALAAADKCLDADPAFLKAYGRKAAAQMGLVRPGDAEMSLKAGLALDARNEFLRSELDKLLQEEDGDQSPKRSKDGSDSQLRQMMGRMSVQISPFAPWPDQIFFLALIGDLKSFTERFRPEHLRLRGLEARLPLLSVVVMGAQRMRAGNPREDMDHAGIMLLLLDSGARVDGKDGIGYTALHHALAHSAVIDLAEILIAAGADVNLQDRFGTNPLISACMAAEVRAVRLLLTNGARTDVKDNDGLGPMDVCSHNAAIQALIFKANDSTRQSGDKMCAACGELGAKKACAGCGARVHYCTRKCQVAHWPSHKASCVKAPAAAAATTGAAARGANGAGRASSRASAANGSGASGSGSGGGEQLPRELRVPIVKEVDSTTLTNRQATLASAMSQINGLGPRPVPANASMVRDPTDTRQGLAAVAPRATRERAMRVKVQVPQDPTDEERRMFPPSMLAGHMLCYNQDRSMTCQLDGESAAGRQLSRLIKQEGILKAKGYFSVYFDESCNGRDGVPKEVIVLTSMLPAQPF